jgi:hypothetical protein
MYYLDISQLALKSVDEALRREHILLLFEGKLNKLNTILHDLGKTFFTCPLKNDFNLSNGISSDIDTLRYSLSHS